MAGKITEFADASALTGGEQLEIVQAGISVKVTVATMAAWGTAAHVTSGAGLDPNSVVTGSPGYIYISAVTLGGDGSVWFKITGVSTTTGWE